MGRFSIPAEGFRRFQGFWSDDAGLFALELSYGYGGFDVTVVAIFYSAMAEVGHRCAETSVSRRADLGFDLGSGLDEAT
ncbi:hypothetical protein [Methylorubrum aminovorans]|uniref:hypothetical protein n=1 Tax=Methylorubrum aminovorans TaxID=269069 RepID=UPI001EDE0748|nr:hypothetical protein [Methylorubrum aminovorans]